jgi:hypothetical protein
MVKRELSDINVEEVSLVDRAANKRTFFFVKRDSSDDGGSGDDSTGTTIKIDSDGTIDGTKANVNGNDIDPHSIHFGFDKDQSPESLDAQGNKNPRKVDFHFCQKCLGTDGIHKTTTHTLSKRDNTEKPVSNEDVTAIRKFLDDNEAPVAVGATDATRIAKALAVLTEYQDAFPASITDAIKDLVKVAVNKAATPNEVSQDLVKQVTDSVVAQLKGTPEPVKKGDTTPAATAGADEEVEVSIDEFIGSIVDGVKQGLGSK